MRTTRRTVLRGAGALGTAGVAAVTVPVVLAACGRGDTPGAQTSAPGDLAGKMMFAMTGGEAQHPPVILESFRARYPKLQIETFMGGWTPTLEKVTEMVAAGTPPDVWYGEEGRATGWGPNGWIHDLASYIRKDLKESDYHYLNAAKDRENRIWGVAGDLQVTALFYNTAAFNEVGLRPPTPDWNLDQLTAAAQRLTDPAKKQYGFFAQPNYITTSWYLFPKLFGVGVLDDSGTRSQFNHPKVLQAHQALMSFIDKGLAPPYADQSKYPFAPAQTAEGRSAMQFAINGAMTNAAYKDFTYELEVIPSGPGGRWATAIANTWVIGKGSIVPDAAWEWIKWQSQFEQQIVRGRANTGLPMNKKAAEDWVTQTPPPPANRRAFLKSLDFAGALGLNAVWQEWRTAAQTELVKAFAGTVSLPNALQEAHRLVQAELDKFYKK